MVKIISFLMSNLLLLGFNHPGYEETNILRSDDISLDKNQIMFKVEGVYNIEQDYVFAFKLNKRLNIINDNNNMGKVGFNFILNNSNIQLLSYNSSFSNLFDRYDDYYIYNYDFATSDLVQNIKYYVNSAIYEISFNTNVKSISLLEVYYTDNSVYLDCAYLGRGLDNISKISNLPTINNQSFKPFKLFNSTKLNKIKSNYGYDLFLPYFQKEYRIIDDIDENIYTIDFINTNNIVLSELKIGLKVYIEAINYSHNIKSKIEVEIVDEIRPTLIKKDTGLLKISSVDLLNFKENINKYFIIYDNYTILDKLDINIINLDNIKNTFGKLKIELLIIDEFNNMTNFNELVLIDDLTLPKAKLKYNHLITTTDKKITKEDIFDLVEAYDEESEIKSADIENSSTYFDNAEIIGTYFVDIKISDNFDNYIYLTLYISVKEKSESVFKSNNTIFYFDNNQIINIDEIIDSLIITSQIKNNKYDALIIEGNDLNNLDQGFNYLLLELDSVDEIIYIDIIIYLYPNIKESTKLSFVNFIDIIVLMFKNIFHIN